VTGTVMFNVGNPLSVNDITLKFQGIEHVFWDESHSHNVTDSNGTADHI
jgi:hypothetical protein